MIDDDVVRTPPTPAAADAVRAELVAALGDVVATDPASLDDARSDRSGYRSPADPIAVVRATEVDHVVQTLRIAHATRTPVVTRGAGTGLAGGATATAGEIVLSVRGMDRILEVSEADELAVVEPGVLNDDLNARLAPLGLWYSPDPASKAISTIGGNIATNAGGLLCAKYGVTREAVLALTVVLADGRVVDTGHRTVKGVTGYDLTALMIGSEGTLGVIVRATVRLRPLPTAIPSTVAAFFPDSTTAAAAASAITAARIRPAAMELLDAGALEAIDAFLGTDHSTRGSAHLLVRCDGPDAAAEAARVVEVVVAGGGTADVTDDADEGERLLAIRRAFHPALAARGRVLIEDVAVPRSRLADMLARIRGIERETGLAIPTVAHAGDGNLHPNFCIPEDPTTPDGDATGIPDEVWRAADLLFRAAVDLGGTLTGEHGVGLLKRRWLADELGDDVMGLAAGIRRVFDPRGILNPGKAA
ncbi:putative FAD-linked oxidoreductase [Clavibacter michiganensis subsp. michiganensis]|uniref:FAD-binding oxidoreductase n=1 Tax=Clavibacter michiganensis TaxID=28447 RepID=UPI001303894D|nr:FAD-linked oxidase C-terminal domain-containing protein [Clavibacter michiganensis]KAF0258680.1 putative FAD-linked oxidoreductase [Clavibacter michiganensis subsp. michiganensis]